MQGGELCRSKGRQLSLYRAESHAVGWPSLTSPQPMHASDEPTPDAPVAALLLAYAVVYVVWGSTYLAIRVAVETLPPLTLTGARLAGGTIDREKFLPGKSRLFLP